MPRFLASRLRFRSLAAAVALTGGPALAAAGELPPLRLHAARPEAVAAAAALGLDAPAAGLWVVRFDGPITTGSREALRATGVEILEYLPDFAYLVRASGPARAAEAASAAGAAAIEPLRQVDKLAPGLLAAMTRDANVSGEASPEIPREVLVVDDAGRAHRAAAGSPLALRALAARVDVRWIGHVPAPWLVNDVAAGILGVAPRAAHGRYGAGQIVAIADSGLDVGETGALSADFDSRVVATHVLVVDEDWDDNNGHGTHTAGSLAGSGVLSGSIPATSSYDGSFAGIAPEASLVVQAFEADASGVVTGLPADLVTLFQQAYDDGARIHSDSWGDYTGPTADSEAAFGGYPFWSQRTDQFIWDHPDFAVFVAAGNSGIDGIPGPLGFCTGGDGVVDPDSLLAPATAKNVVTVGASESVRSTGLGPAPWLLISFCFATEPIASDTLSDDADGLAAFSSRGPADDGRVKPDLVAPGTNIVSAASHAPGATTLWGVHETNANYNYSGGTSMATPLVAGMGALVREALTSGRAGLAAGDPVDPSAALVKAFLLAGATSIAPGQYGGGATQEVPNATPNHVAGWGRADLELLAPSDPHAAFWFDDHTAGLATGGTVEYSDSPTTSLKVTDGTMPLRLQLVWSDPPASLVAASQLVNDLDLTVVGPDDTIYRGNGGGTPDRVNNVEGVVIPNPLPGLYSVEVAAFNVPIATQPYALVVYGPVSSYLFADGFESGDTSVWSSTQPPP